MRRVQEFLPEDFYSMFQASNDCSDNRKASSFQTFWHPAWRDRSCSVWVSSIIFVTLFRWLNVLCSWILTFWDIAQNKYTVASHHMYAFLTGVRWCTADMYFPSGMCEQYDKNIGREYITWRTESRIPNETGKFSGHKWSQNMLHSHV